MSNLRSSGESMGRHSLGNGSGRAIAAIAKSGSRDAGAASRHRPCRANSGASSCSRGILEELLATGLDALEIRSELGPLEILLGLPVHGAGQGPSARARARAQRDPSPGAQPSP